MNRINKKIFIFLLIIFISIGFAYLSAYLDIKGIANIKKIKWNLYFDNIQKNYGEEFEVTAPTTSGTNTTEINFEVALEDPGDSYSFDVDIVNNGTIDAIFDLKTDNTIITEAQRKIYDFNIKYKDGIEINKNDLLAKNTKDTITITITYKKDIEIADLPSSDSTVNFSIVLSYEQANIKGKSANIRSRGYTITYNLNGGINSPNNPSIYTTKTETFSLEEPTKEGYIFTGWTMGKNLYNYPDNVQSRYGLTATVNNTTGNITITGVPTRDYASIAEITIDDIIKDKVQYTFSNNSSAFLYGQFYIKNKNTNAITYAHTMDNDYVFKADKSLYSYRIALQSYLMSLWGTNSRTITNHFQLEEGEKTDFEPYISIPTKTITIPLGSNGNRTYTANWEEN